MSYQTRTVRRIVLFVIAALLFAYAATPVAAAGVGQHIHVEVGNHPADKFPIARGPYTFHVTLKLHNFPARLRYLRVDDGSTTRASLTIPSTTIPAMGPCADCSQSFNWTVNFSSWSVGRHEIRWHADSQDSDPGTTGTQRQYTTSRQQICIVSCTPSYRSQTNFSGGGSWYTGPEYVVALLLSPMTSVKPGGSVVIRSQYSNAFVCGFLNPDFHHGSNGTPLGCGSKGTSNKTITIPSTASPGDRLVVVANGGKEAGVYAVNLGDGSPRATLPLQFQSWWNLAGITTQ